MAADIKNDVGSSETKKLKIMTWNINGIRAVTRGKDLKEFLDALDADVMCFQETKITRDMLEESICIVEGYNAYFSCSRVKTGYSGVATFCKDTTTPCAAEEGLTPIWTQEPTIGCYSNTDCFTPDQLSSLDKEGRAVLTEYKLDNGEQVVIINVYCPRADPDNEERMEFKLQYYKLLQMRVEALLESGRHVIVLGDLNVAHKPIDHCNPGDHDKFNAHPSRVWMGQFVKEITATEVDQPEKLLYSPYFKVSTIEGNHDVSFNVSSGNKFEPEGSEKHVSVAGILVDSFRFLHLERENAFTNWCTSTGARQTNYGNRIDYILADVLLVKQKFTDCVVRPEVEGSDHCPVVAHLKGHIIPSKRAPALCAKSMPEFAGKQQKLVSYFTKKPSETTTNAAKANTVDYEESRSSQESPRKRPDEIPLEVTERSLKRAANSELSPKAKRAKTSQPNKQNKLLQFFGKMKAQKVLEKSESSSFNEAEKTTNFQSSNSSNSDDDFQPDSLRSVPGSNETIENGSDSKRSAEEPTKPSDPIRKAEVAIWKNILKGPPPAPLCPGHSEPSVLRTVKKKGPNYGRQFHCCARPEGHFSNKEARCRFFKWTK